MNTQFKKGIVEMCVLSLIDKQDMYGFEVIEILSQFIDVNENTIYPILRRLTAQKLFDTYETSSAYGAPRKYYKITELGKTTLIAYQKEWSLFLEGVSQILGGTHNEK